MSTCHCSTLVFVFLRGQDFAGASETDSWRQNSTYHSCLRLNALCTFPAHSHDRRRPDLDACYGSLDRPGLASCCLKNDCHATEAELQASSNRPRLA
jgi:hypothetical protein